VPTLQHLINCCCFEPSEVVRLTGGGGGREATAVNEVLESWQKTASRVVTSSAVGSEVSLYWRVLWCRWLSS
jgi:hypothetical protein